MKGGTKIPTLQAVNAAWLTARAGQVVQTDNPHRYPMLPHEARPFYQGVILQCLAADRVRRKAAREKRPSFYRPLTTPERRAVKLTRLWLEFGDL